MGPGDRGRRLAGQRDLLPGAALSVLPRARLHPLRPEPARGAPVPDRAGLGRLRPPRDGRKPALLEAGGHRRGGDGGRLRAGHLLRRPGPEDRARPVPAVPPPRPARPARHRAGPAPGLAVARRGARRPRADTRERPRLRRGAPGLARRVARHGAAALGARGGPGPRAGPRAPAGGGAEPGGRGRVPADDGPVRTQLLHRQQPRRRRHLPSPRAGARRPPVRTP